MFLGPECRCPVPPCAARVPVCPPQREGELAELALALRDAQKAAEIEPAFVRAHWRAADAALVLGQEADAVEHVEAGLKLAPTCGPLLQLKLRVKRF